MNCAPRFGFGCSKQADCKAQGRDRRFEAGAFRVQIRSQQAPHIGSGTRKRRASRIALKKNKAVAGFKDWLKVVFDFKHGFFAYALAILLPILHLILTCMIGGYEKGSPIYMLIPLIPAMIVGGGLEEAGWSIITFPELNKKFNFVVSGIITTAIWY